MTLRIGFGRIDITPPIGVELAGFGPFLRRRSASVHGPIYGRALAVEHNSGRWVIVSCDLLGVAEATVRTVAELVADHTGWRTDEVVVHATHNHSGPATLPDMIGWGEIDQDYFAQLSGLIARSCIDAIDDLSDGWFHHAEVPLERFAHNRMSASDGLTNAGALDGTWEEPDRNAIDTTVHVLSAYRMRAGTAQLAGFVAYYSCHPVVCCEQCSTIHGDFPGEALHLVEDRFSCATGVYLSGSLGDINPQYAHGPQDESRRALEMFARRFAEAVSHGIAAGRPLRVDLVRAQRNDVRYDLAPVDVSALTARRDQSFGTPMAAVITASLDRTLALLATGADVRRPVTASLLVLGPLTLIGFNLEVFHGIKRRLQSELGALCLVMSTTNGYLGYAPTRDAYLPSADPYPAYEMPIIVSHLPFEADIEDRLVAAACNLSADVTHAAHVSTK
jgi:hypothetical protein